MRITIGDYLLKRLKEVGINHIIGIPGDFNLQFLEQIRDYGEIEFVGSSNELNAAYTADGYARQAGLSALCLTYGVGDLGAINGVAGSRAEHVPVIVITGAPPNFARIHSYNVHHSLADGDLKNIERVYNDLDIPSKHINFENAAEVIDETITYAMVYKKPVNIQLPSNLSYLEIETDMEPLDPFSFVSDEKELQKVTSLIAEKLKKATNPAVLIDMDVDRLEIKEEILRIIEKGQIQFAQMSTGKAILDENHPLFIGTYKGDDTKDMSRERLEHSDFLLTVAPRFIEWNSGTYSVNLPMDRTVYLDRFHTFVGEEVFEGVHVKDVLEGVIERMEEVSEKKNLNTPVIKKKISIDSEDRITHSVFWDIIGGIFRENDAVYAETGTSLLALGEVRMPKNTSFIGSSIWGAIGYMLPTCFGGALADRERRHILFIGDGSFQITAQELSRIQYTDVNPIIFLINNRGYTIERYIMGMKAPYNDIPDWKYSELPGVFDRTLSMRTYRCETVGELEEVLKVLDDGKKGTFIEVIMEKGDAPDPLKKFGPAVADFNYGDRGPINEEPEPVSEEKQEEN